MGKIMVGKTQMLLMGTLLLASVFVMPLPTPAGVSVQIGIPLPPVIRFAEPPRLVVLPETYVYVAPDVEEEIFFYDGWWWRPWEGNWYRSREYGSGWHHYKNVPSFYRKIPRDWRNDYRDNRWRGHQWRVEQLPHNEVQRNWKNWRDNKHWERERNWGVEDSRHRSDSQRSSREGRERHSRD